MFLLVGTAQLVVWALPTMCDPGMAFTISALSTGGNGSPIGRLFSVNQLAQSRNRIPGQLDTDAFAFLLTLIEACCLNDGQGRPAMRRRWIVGRGARSYGGESKLFFNREVVKGREAMLVKNKYWHVALSTKEMLRRLSLRLFSSSSLLP